MMTYQHINIPTCKRTSMPTCKPITMVIYIAGSISLFRGKRSNHFRLQRQSKHGALRRLKGQAAAPFPDKSSSRFAASVFIGKIQRRGLHPRNDSRPRFPCRIVRGGESQQGIIREDYTRAKRENDGIRVGCFGWQAQQPLESMMIYQHTNISTCKPITMVIYIAGSIPLFRGKRSKSFPFIKAKQVRGFMSAKRSGGCAVSR